MAFRSFIPAALTLTLYEGMSFYQVLEAEELDENGDVIPLNLSEYDAVAPTIVFKDSETELGGVSTNSPSGTCAFVSSVSGSISVTLTQTQTNVATGANSTQEFGGVVEIYVTHQDDYESGSSGPKKRTLLWKGTYSVVRTASAT